MNYQMLFQKQRELDQHIIKEKQLNETELLPGKILALLVELGELANEQQTWKFWKDNPKPRTKVLRHPAMMPEDQEWYNPLLEEYVDGWHFIISIGLDLKVDELDLIPIKQKNLVEQFNGLFNVISTLAAGIHHNYKYVVQAYLGLGEMLGFSSEEVEQAYLKKNAINHQRQEEGY